ncbi:MAG TPA: putative dsRNA-binding protein, partial [Candidatus Limnocylindrales bacterium]
FRIEVAVGGRIIGMGQGHSRRVAETEAAARAIETLRSEPGDLAEGEVGAPELAEFGGAEGDLEDDPSLPWAAEPADRREADPADRVDRDPADRREAEPADRRQAEPWIEMDIGLLDLGSQAGQREETDQATDSKPSGEDRRS